MRDFFTLVSIENTKLWKRLSSKIMLIILIVIILAAHGIYKYYNVSHDVSNTISVSENWKEELQKELDANKVQLTQMEKGSNGMSTTLIGSIKKNIAENEYRINNNIKPESKRSIWTRVTKFDGDAGYSSIIALLLIIACSALIAGEFSEGTMKMMISRPYRRSEILTAKLVSAILYGIALLLTTFLLNFILIGVLYGFNGIGAKEMLWTGSKIIYIPAVLKTLTVFGLDFLMVLVYVIVAFALSAIFRSRSLATGFSLFLFLVVSGIVGILATYFSWGKYLPFGLTNFTAYVNTGVAIEGTSLGFALISSALYSILFCFGGYFFFIKRDI